MGAKFVLLDLNPDVKVSSVTTDMVVEEVEFTKKMIAILHFMQCQLKIFRNLHITCLKYNILSFIIT